MFFSDCFVWPATYRYPDVIYQDRLTFRHGDLTFELHHARGETDDATWTWVPELKVLHPGDFNPDRGRDRVLHAGGLMKTAQLRGDRSFSDFLRGVTQLLSPDHSRAHERTEVLEHGLGFSNSLVNEALVRDRLTDFNVVTAFEGLMRSLRAGGFKSLIDSVDNQAVRSSFDLEFLDVSCCFTRS